MALIKPAASDEVRRALIAAIADFVEPDDPLGPALHKAELGLHIFTLGLSNIANQEGFADAKSAGWRFLAGSSVGEAIAGDVMEIPPGTAPRMTSVSHDPLVGRAIQAVHELESLPEVHDQDYELNVVRIPGLLIEAFWLKSRGKGPDLVIPVLTRETGLKRMKPYPMEQFLTEVEPLVEKFLAF